MSWSPCSVDGCGDPALARTLCNKHYHRWRAYGTTDLPERPPAGPCSIEDCGKPAVSRGWCQTHYMRWIRRGTTDLVPQRNAHGHETHCPQGHPYDEENTYLYRGRRYCRECHRSYTRRWRSEQAVGE